MRTPSRTAARTSRATEKAAAHAGGGFSGFDEGAGRVDTVLQVPGSDCSFILVVCSCFVNKCTS